MEILSLETLPLLDNGAIAIAVDNELKAIYRDLLDRDNLTKPRELNLKLKFTPDKPKAAGDVSGGILEDVLIAIEITSKIPGKGTLVRTKNVPRLGGIGFHSDTNNTSFDPDQNELPYTDE